MIALLQRVRKGTIEVKQHEIAPINQRLLVFIGIKVGDTIMHAQRLLQRLLSYRIFDDSNKKMNLSLKDIKGGLLLVPQFTLAVYTINSLRPSFNSAASPEVAEQLFHHLCRDAQHLHYNVETGQFGSNMQVSLINDGPATFLLQDIEKN